MRVCGIVAEYDPFHKGHYYQLEEAKQNSSADYIICVISTAFTQRGMPGLLSTRDRAEMALLAGADLVLGMPVSYSCSQANRFAMGGVGILQALGVVSHLSFGIEKESLPHLFQIRDLLLNPSIAYKKALQESLSQGQSFARAQGNAIANYFSNADNTTINQPNFNLALCYLQAISILNSSIEPMPVIRQGHYHDTKITALPSASAVRAAILRGDWPSVEAALPLCSFQIVKAAAEKNHFHLPDALDKALLSLLAREKDYSEVLEMSEGLDLRMLNYSREARSRTELIELIKTKRYPYARISRAISQSLIGIKKQPLAPPAYARLLGFRKRASPLLQAIGKNHFPLISRPAKSSDPNLKIDMYAEQLWHIGSNQASADAYRQKLIII
ncbi:MAG: nucleotidyltransferase family protein [Clostridiales bacterium]|nr:nucleotidyltransferase family protein [Clostridiales bacterium]